MEYNTYLLIMPSRIVLLISTLNAIFFAGVSLLFYSGSPSAEQVKQSNVSDVESYEPVETTKNICVCDSSDGKIFNLGVQYLYFIISMVFIQIRIMKAVMIHLYENVFLEFNHRTHESRHVSRLYIRFEYTIFMTYYPGSSSFGDIMRKVCCTLLIRFHHFVVRKLCSLIQAWMSVIASWITPRKRTDTIYKCDAMANCSVEGSHWNKWESYQAHPAQSHVVGRAEWASTFTLF